MTPRHPLSANSSDRNWSFWGGLVLLAILVLTIRWTRGPAPTDLISGPTPYPTNPSAPNSANNTVTVGQSAGSSIAATNPNLSAERSTISPLPITNTAQSGGQSGIVPTTVAPPPSVPSAVVPTAANQAVIPQVGPGQQSVAIPGLPSLAPTSTPVSAAAIPKVQAPTPGLTVLTSSKPPVVTPAQLVGTSNVPKVIPAYWVATVQMPPVNAILAAPDGKLWVATDRGLAEISGERITFHSRVDGTFPAAQATCLAHDGRALWIGTFEGLYRTEDGKRYRRFGTNDGLAHDMVWSLDWDGTVLWVGTQQGFSFLVPNANGRFETVDKKISNGGLADLWIGSIRKVGRWLLAGNDDGLSIWDTASFAANPSAWITLDMFTSGLLHNWILAISIHQDQIYVGTPHGLCRLETPIDQLFGGSSPTWTTWNRDRGLPGDRVNALFGWGDTLWIGTHEGLARLRGGVVRSITIADGLLASDVRALTVAGELLWVGSSDGLQALNPALLDRQ